MNKCLFFIASVMAAQLMIVRSQSMMETMMMANMMGQGSGSGSGAAGGMQNMAALTSLLGQRPSSMAGSSSSAPAGLSALSTMGGGGQQASGGQSPLARMFGSQGGQGSRGMGMGSMFPLASGMSLDTILEFNLCRQMFGRSRLPALTIMMYCNSRAA